MHHIEIEYIVDCLFHFLFQIELNQANHMIDITIRERILKEAWYATDYEIKMNELQTICIKCGLISKRSWWLCKSVRNNIVL